MEARLYKTALLFFTKTVASEAASKSFVRTAEKNVNRKISSLLINHTRTIALSTNLPLYEITNQQQVGNTFGERLSNAIADIFDKNFENVIVIGNDCPQLTADIIKTAERMLTRHQLVAGPDQRGGVYLIGINRNVFDKENLANRQWQTSYLLKDLQAAYSNISSFQLPLLKDVNNFEDLKSLQQLLPSFGKLKLLLISLLASRYKINHLLHFDYINPAFSLFGLRAPPTV